jgi:hypothetical protein
MKVARRQRVLENTLEQLGALNIKVPFMLPPVSAVKGVAGGFTGTNPVGCPGGQCRGLSAHTRVPLASAWPVLVTNVPWPSPTSFQIRVISPRVSRLSLLLCAR